MLLASIANGVSLSTLGGRAWSSGPRTGEARGWKRAGPPRTPRAQEVARWNVVSLAGDREVTGAGKILDFAVAKEFDVRLDVGCADDAFVRFAEDPNRSCDNLKSEATLGRERVPSSARRHVRDLQVKLCARTTRPSIGSGRHLETHRTEHLHARTRGFRSALLSALADLGARRATLNRDRRRPGSPR